MKVIFLDIDGVLNSTDYMNATHVNYRENVNAGYIKYPIPEDCFIRDKYGVKFDPRCVMWLNALIVATKAKIIISSTWRLGGEQLMRKMWINRSLPGEVIGITPTNTYSTRGEEIRHVVNALPRLTKYCIIDDDNDMLEEQQLNFVKTSNKYGLNLESYKQAKKILLN